MYMDENGDAEGNYTLIARKMSKDKEKEYGLFPVGVFSLDRTDSRLPVSKMHSEMLISLDVHVFCIIFKFPN